MAKTKREIAEDIKIIDVVIEILDARIPISSQNPDIKILTKQKKKIILLNKCDLANEVETKKWQIYFKKQGIETVQINANDGKGINQTISKIEEVMQEEMQKEALKGRVGKTIRALVLGIPNVGKSSFINKISKKNSLKVGNKPGVTLKKQWICLSKNIELLDTPRGTMAQIRKWRSRFAPSFHRNNKRRNPRQRRNSISLNKIPNKKQSNRTMRKIQTK